MRGNGRRRKTRESRQDVRRQSPRWTLGNRRGHGGGGMVLVPPEAAFVTGANDMIDGGTTWKVIYTE